MSKSFKNLREKMQPEHQKMAKEKAELLMKEMPIHELRKARQLSQERLAETLGKKQASISKIEHRTDMYISTIRSYIEAMGGQLKIIAHFPDGDVVIKQFHDIEDNTLKAT